MESLEDRRVLATFTVTSLADAGAGSLRDAVAQANANAGADTIDFAASVLGNTINITSGEILISDSVAIDATAGARVTVDAGDLTRIFKISDGNLATVIDVSMNNLRLSNGNSKDEAAGSTLDQRRGGAIDTRENLTLINVELADNAGRRGGALGVRGPLGFSGEAGPRPVIVIQDSLFENNAADAVEGDPAAPVGRGGAISMIVGEMTITNTTFRGNAAGTLGGVMELSVSSTVVMSDLTLDANTVGERAMIYASQFSQAATANFPATSVVADNLSVTNNVTSTLGPFGAIHISQGGSMTLTNSTLTGNAGGVGVSGWATDGFSGVLTVENSVISGNGDVGAMAEYYDPGGGMTMNIVRSTISNNSNTGIQSGNSNVNVIESTISGNSTTTDGGAIAVFGNASIGNYAFTLRNSTVTNNSATDVNSLAGGAYVSEYANFSLDGSILSGNTTAGFGQDLYYLGYGSAITLSHSLVGDNEGSPLIEAQTPDATGSLIGSSAGGGVIDAMLAALADNGGPTLTHMPMVGSPVIDAGDPGVSGGTDQRGAARVVDGNGDSVAVVDMGSVEYLSDVEPPFEPCDFDQDGDCDIDDIDALIGEIASGANNAAFDLTADSLVNLDDRDAWLAQAGALNQVSGNPYLLGDANLSGAVDVSDFNLWNANKFTPTAKWSQADFNADGSTDVSDFNLWNANKFQTSLAAAALPSGQGSVADHASVVGDSRDRYALLAHEKLRIFGFDDDPALAHFYTSGSQTDSGEVVVPVGVFDSEAPAATLTSSVVVEMPQVADAQHSSIAFSAVVRAQKTELAATRPSSARTPMQDRATDLDEVFAKLAWN